MKLLRNLSNTIITGFDFTVALSAVPKGSRKSIFKIAEYLRSTGSFTEEQTNALVASWLILQGQEKQHLNDMLHGYLGTLGFEGSLQDRLSSWSAAP